MRSKLSWPWLTVAAALLITGCVSRGLDSEMTGCTYPDSTRTPAPQFICNQSVDGFHLTRLTSVPDSDTGTRERIQQGREQIEQALMDTWMTDWFDTVSAGQTDRARTLIQDWLRDEMRVVRTRTSPTGTLWLLTGFTRTPEEVQAHVRAHLQAGGLDLGR